MAWEVELFVETFSYLRETANVPIYPKESNTYPEPQSLNFDKVKANKQLAFYHNFRR